MTDISSTRQKIIEQAQLKSQTLLTNKDNDFKSDAWLLLGTTGCHLCDEAENILRLFTSVTPVSIAKVDIADFDETFMMQFATIIPVIICHNQQLNYPFSLPDLQQAYQTDFNEH